MPLVYSDPNSNKLAVTVLPNNIAYYVEYINLAAFPVTGTSGTLYLALDNRKLYSWDGVQYQEVSASTSTASPINIQKDGIAQVTAVNNINFTGSNITISGSGSTANVSVSGSGTSNIAVSDEGSSLTTAVTSFNFVGAGVTATNTSGAVTVTIPGGSGSSSNISIQDDSIAVASNPTALNFGTGLTASVSGGIVTINNTATSSNLAIQDEGTGLTSTPTSINFVGAGVTATTSGNAVTVTIPGSSSSSLTVQDEGVSLTTATTSLNFVGAGVTATNTSGAVTVTIPGGSGSSAITIQDEGSSLSTTVNTFNFTGAGVTASGTGNTITVNIPGGGSSIAVSDEGSSLTTAATSFNFTGTGVTATNTGGAVTVNIPGGSGSAITAQDEGTNLTTALAQLNFVGGGVTATNSTNNVTVTIPSKKVIVVDAMADVNVTISNPGTAVFNQQTVATGGKVFLAFQTTASENGVYTFNGSGSAMTRVTAYSTVDAILESEVIVKNGVINVTGSTWVNTNTAANLTTIGTDAITYKFIHNKGRLFIARAINVTGNVTIATPGATPANGVTLTAGNIVALASQTALSENGLYIFDTATTPLIRLPNYRTDDDIRNSIIQVTEGARGGALFRNTNTATITLGTSNITYEFMAGNRGSTTVTGTATGSIVSPVVIINSTATMTFTLPDPTGATGKSYVVKRADATAANIVTIAGNIDTNASATFNIVERGATTGYNSFIFESNGSTWYLVAGFRFPTT